MPRWTRIVSPLGEHRIGSSARCGAEDSPRFARNCPAPQRTAARARVNLSRRVQMLSRGLHAQAPRQRTRRARFPALRAVTRALSRRCLLGRRFTHTQEVIMSTTPTLEVLHASVQAHTEDILRMCADIQAHLEAQQAMLGRLRRVLEARGVQFPAA